MGEPVKDAWSEVAEGFAKLGSAMKERYRQESDDAPGDAAYAAAKAALTALAQAIAAEVLADGVRVNLVLPSTIDTAANRQAMPSADHARWVTTDSLGDVIQFLLSERARDISGAAVPVYGRVNV